MVIQQMPRISSLQDYCLPLSDIGLDQPTADVKNRIFLQFDHLAIISHQLTAVLQDPHLYL
jgi:hypothetical protein